MKKTMTDGAVRTTLFHRFCKSNFVSVLMMVGCILSTAYLFMCMFSTVIEQTALAALSAVSVAAVLHLLPAFLATTATMIVYRKKTKVLLGLFIGVLFAALFACTCVFTLQCFDRLIPVEEMAVSAGRSVTQSVLFANECIADAASMSLIMAILPLGTAAMVFLQIFEKREERMRLLAKPYGNRTEKEGETDDRNQ